ncbi:MAG TPA: hypothetical protein EYP91_14855 [Gammaproteobacteria bacterium]|nr:hypothetical protein [Gammaproteobacteria bacterium]
MLMETVLPMRLTSAQTQLPVMLLTPMAVRMLNWILIVMALLIMPICVRALLPVMQLTPMAVRILRSMPTVMDSVTSEAPVVDRQIVRVSIFVWVLMTTRMLMVMVFPTVVTTTITTDHWVILMLTV